MQKLSGSVLSSIFAALSGIHVYWALGGQRGLGYVLPTQSERRLISPPPAATWSVALALFGGVVTTLGRMRLWGRRLPLSLFRLGMWTISVVFLLRAIGDFRTVGFWKTITDTQFARWDTRLFSPLCITIAALAALSDATTTAAEAGNG